MKRLPNLLCTLALGWVLTAAACSDDGTPVEPDAALADTGPDGEIDAGSGDSGTNLAEALVATTGGLVQGRIVQGVAEFLGIPYAAPPVGERRWRAPEPPESWEGIRPATEYGPACPQLANAIALTFPGADYSEDCPEDCQGDFCCVGSEDCLYANVWTPAHTPGAGLPVMVWIHGGGFNTGAGSLAMYDGAALARARNVVVVTFNYRLGPLGFLAHPGLTEEATYHASGNYGLLDQIRLLEWVRGNIAEFGGDPGNVTVFGESAGGVSICYLLASPLARGLFHKAINESGPCPQRRSVLFLDSKPEGQPNSAHEQGETAAARLGCDAAPDPVACMRSLRAADIFQGLQPSSGLFVPGMKFGGIVDGHLVEDAPLAVLQAGGGADVPAIFGDTANEASLWRPVAAMPALGGSGYTLQDADETVDPTKFAEVVTFLVGEDAAPDILALYPNPSTGSEALLAYEEFLTDGLFICPVRRAASAQSAQGNHVWFYLFQRVPPDSFAAREGFGAFHASEIPYVFGNLADGFQVYRPLTQDDTTLSETMGRYWTRFAATGSPNDSADPEWPELTAPPAAHILLDVPIQDATGIRRERCDAFDALLESAACQNPVGRPYACYW